MVCPPIVPKVLRPVTRELPSPGSRTTGIRWEHARSGREGRPYPVARLAVTGHVVGAGDTTWAVRALVRAASSTAAVATASQGSTGTGWVPRTAAANAG